MGDAIAQEYFDIDPLTGEIRTKRTLMDVPSDQLPFQIILVASDNPDGSPENQLTQKTILVVSAANPCLRGQWVKW